MKYILSNRKGKIIVVDFENDQHSGWVPDKLLPECSSLKMESMGYYWGAARYFKHQSIAKLEEHLSIYYDIVESLDTPYIYW